MDAGQLLTDRLDQKGGDHGGIDAAGQGEKYFAVADLRAERGQLLVDKCPGQLGGSDSLHRFRALIVRHEN